LSQLDQGKEVSVQLPVGRHAWLQVLRGSVTLNNQALETSDGVAISDVNELHIQATTPAEVMLFDLA
jgi:redox-sensitive bicupin YhaK (pirin superfamily)